jgi:hypothetical protein
VKSFSSLSSRAVLLTGAVSAIAVLIAGIVAFPLIRTAAQDQAQATLASQANLIHNIAISPNDFDIDNGSGNPESPQRALLGVVKYLQVQGIEVQAIIPGQVEPKELSAAQLRAIASGRDVSGRTCGNGR